MSIWAFDDEGGSRAASPMVRMNFTMLLYASSLYSLYMELYRDNGSVLLLLLPSTPNFYRGILYTTAEGAGRRRAAACGLGENMFGILLTSRESNCMCILKLMNLSQGSSTWVRR